MFKQKISVSEEKHKVQRDSSLLKKKKQTREKDFLFRSHFIGTIVHQLAQHLPGKIPLSFYQLFSFHFSPSSPSWQWGSQCAMLKSVREDGAAGDNCHSVQGDQESKNLLFLIGDFEQEMHAVPPGSSLSLNLMGQRLDAVH